MDRGETGVNAVERMFNDLYTRQPRAPVRDTSAPENEN
jgi:hypothetical protein